MCSAESASTLRPQQALVQRSPWLRQPPVLPPHSRKVLSLLL